MYSAEPNRKPYLLVCRFFSGISSEIESGTHSRLYLNVNEPTDIEAEPGKAERPYEAKIQSCPTVVKSVSGYSWLYVFCFGFE